ncbi:L-cystine-binding protein FliY [Sporomusa termitida]|uniref:L-cystine-binding protein FliY n=1 Tax=Sporomusa termitida TaxID=2377 RepID=A0A517DZ69_9FIRM|nr:L-cystine-binding protein FliY [Sporomusa termitida]
MRRILVFISLVAMVSMLLVGCGASTTTSEKQGGPVWSRIEQAKVMKVAFEGTYPPFNYQNEQKQFAGFDVDISNEIAKRLGVKAEFIATPWEGLIGGLQADKFDIVIAQMSITEERKKSVDFTDPYVNTGGVLITRQDTNDINKLEDIKDKKVGVGGGTTFEKVARSVQGADVRTYKSAGEYFTDLQNKRLDVIINDSMVAAYRIKQNNLPLKTSTTFVSKDLIGMAAKQGNGDFVEKVNKALAEIKQDGTYEQLFIKWFGVKPVTE